MHCIKCNNQFSNPEVEYFEKIYLEDGVTLFCDEFIMNICPKCRYKWASKIDIGEEMKKEIKGTMSFYGVDPIKEHLNEFTASGDKFDPTKLTCALPKSIATELGIYRKWGTKIRIETYRSYVDVIYNDTGPNERLGRIADVTPAVLNQLGFEEYLGLFDGSIRVIK